MGNSYLSYYFEKNIIERGKEYFKNSMVSDIVLKENVLTSIVEGSGNNRYKVIIEFDTVNSLKINSISCTCPYGRNCKHAVATLLYFFSFGPDQEIQEEIKNPLNELDNYVEEEKNISFIEDDTPSRIKDLILDKAIKKEVKKIQDKVIGKIALEFDEDYYYRENTKWYIFPVYQIIKKDGTGGRIVKYSPGKIDIENIIIEEKLKTFYESLLDNSEMKLYAKRYIDYIIEHNTPLYLAINGHYDILTYKKIHKIKLSFEIYHFNKDYISFKPYFYIYTDEKTFQKNSLKSKNIIKSKNSMYIIDLNSCTLFYFDKIENNSTVLNAIYEIIKTEYSYSYKDIEELIKFLNEKKDNLNIEIIFDKNKFIYKTVKPKAIIEIYEDDFFQRGELTVKIVYNDQKVPYSGDSYYPYTIKHNLFPEEPTIIYKRDIKLEKKIFKYICNKISAYIEDIVETTLSSYQHDGTKIILKRDTKKFLEAYGYDLITDGFEIRYRDSKKKLKSSRGNLKVRIESDINWFETEVKFEDQDGNEFNINFEANDLEKGIINIDDGYVILSKDDIARLKKFKELGLNSNGKLSINKLDFSKIDKLYDEIKDKNQDLIKTKEIIEKIKNFNKIEIKELPKKFNGTLREYQHAGYNWLFFLYEYDLNGCLADDMGLGKTVQTVAFLEKLKEENKLKKALLVVPVSTIPNWEKEIERFTPDLKVVKHYGNNRVNNISRLDGKDIIITSYHTLRNDIEIFKEIEFTYLILDEAQNIKNARSLTFKSIKLINAQHKLSLTGTPIENNTLELWAQFNFLNPTLLGSLQEFRKIFANPIEKYKSKDTAKALREIVYPFILRRKKEDVLKELPPKEEIVYYCEMEDDQRKLYENLKNDYHKLLETEIEKNGIEKSAMLFFEALLRLRQACLLPELIGKNFSDISSCKYQALTDLIEDILAENHKIIIFSQFIAVLKKIETLIRKHNINYSYIDGSIKDRQKEIDNFQNDPNVRVFLITLKAGGVGINLTKADYVILFDPWWNPAVENQAVDRAHRIGQTNKVTVYKLIAEKTVEEKILMLQERKKTLVSEIVTEDTAFFKSLSKDDILDLFS